MMDKLKNKIDLMENLDDLEKYQGKWRNNYLTKGVYWLGDYFHDSVDDAAKSNINWIEKTRLCFGDAEFNLEDTNTGKLIVRCRLSDIIYLGAIPVKP